MAVSHDPIGNRAGAYYVNTQIGEDLVTNPYALSLPEELLLLQTAAVRCSCAPTRWSPIAADDRRADSAAAQPPGHDP